MLILGIDSSGSACTGAVSDDGRIIDSFRIISKKSHSEMLLPNIASLLKKNSLSLDNIDALAISCGPGSYTGLRIGISTVKGLAVTRKIKCIPLSSLQALCLNYVFPEKSIVSALIDARRDEFYQAFFVIENGFPKRLSEDRAIIFDELKKETEEKGIVYLIGDGVEKYIKLSGKEFQTVPQDDNFAKGESVCRLAFLLKDEFCDAEKLSPIYLKKSQAEREYENTSEVEK